MSLISRQRDAFDGYVTRLRTAFPNRENQPSGNIERAQFSMMKYETELLGLQAEHDQVVCDLTAFEEQQPAPNTAELEEAISESVTELETSSNASALPIILS